MIKISDKQIRMARAMLGWPQEKLAKEADLSITTIRNLETGYISERSTLKAQAVFERNGIVFTEDDGVKRRNDLLKVYKDNDSCGKFFADIQQTIDSRGGDVTAVLVSSHSLLVPTGLTRQPIFQRLEQLAETVSVKCVIAEPFSSYSCASRMQIRTMHKTPMGASTYFVFGNKYADLVYYGQSDFTIVVCDFPLASQARSEHFSMLWEMSASLMESSSYQKRHAKSLNRF